MVEDGRGSAWDNVAADEAPSWYLDPLVAAQKREEHMRLIRKMEEMLPGPERVLKTDLFEEAFGEDQILGSFPLTPRLLCGIDVAPGIVKKCAGRFVSLRGNLPAADLRALPFRDGSFDWIVSNSSLDHFDSREELAQALGELCRVLAPGGVLLLTFDNPGNPLYHLLRFASRRGWAPFPLGSTITAEEARRMLEDQGLRTLAQEYFLFNPRGLSTLLFLILRKAMGRRGDMFVGALLRCFAGVGSLPGKRWSACFHATWALRPSVRSSSDG